MELVPKYSVIVPIYNAEATLQHCVDSILAQTYINFELILVNDGSTDSSQVIINQYATLDPRIRTIHKPNGGVSSARNAALDIARGNYVTFIDSDDYINKFYLEKFDIINPDSDELVIASASIIDKFGNLIKRIRIGHQFDIPLSIEEGFVLGRLLYFGFSWGKLYNTETVKKYNIKFPEDLSFKEDLIFMLEYLKYCSKIRFIGNIGYKYYVHIGSLSTTKHTADVLIKSTQHIISSAFIKKHSQNDGIQDCMKDYLRLCMREILESIYSDKNINFRKRLSILRMARLLMYNGKIHPTEYRSDKILRIMFRMKLFISYDLIQYFLYFFRKRLD